MFLSWSPSAPGRTSDLWLVGKLPQSDTPYSPAALYPLARLLVLPAERQWNGRRKKKLQNTSSILSQSEDETC